MKRLTLGFFFLPISVHPKTLLRERGFRLGFVLRSARRVGSGLYHRALILYHLTTARRWRSGDTQRFGFLYSKFEFAVQDAIKTPAKAPLPQEGLMSVRCLLASILVKNVEISTNDADQSLRPVAALAADGSASTLAVCRL